ncbi:MAG: metal ABC transporter substrate-binding protein [Acidimicrobiales bacterium]|nr:metal ABC transporter substrate-binding protein [Acidimicrobiales bacterium]
MRPIPRILMTFAALALVAAGCGGDDDTSASADGRPTVVVTTNILGDVVTNLTGDAVDVLTIMPVGADPHDFQASAQQATTMRTADALIVNGADFEEGLIDVIRGAESDGVAIFEAISAVSTIEFGAGGHDHDEDHDEDHDSDEDHDEDHDGHDHEGADPHFFTDPARMALAVPAIADFLIDNVDGLDIAAVEAAAAAYAQELADLDTEVAAVMDAIPAESRVLITNHEVFGYFADRYGFEVVGTVIPSGSTLDGTSAGGLAELAGTIEAEGVAAIFSDTSASDQLAQTLADEVGDIAVVELYTESLGDAGSDGATYVSMIRSNAERISAALGG